MGGNFQRRQKERRTICCCSSTNIHTIRSTSSIQLNKIHDDANYLLLAYTSEPDGGFSNMWKRTMDHFIKNKLSIPSCCCCCRMLPPLTRSLEPYLLPAVLFFLSLAWLVSSKCWGCLVGWLVFRMRNPTRAIVGQIWEAHKKVQIWAATFFWKNQWLNLEAHKSWKP